MSTAVDHYPSRNGREATLEERLDPVVYSEDLSKSPIDPELIKGYRQNGFMILDNIFSEEEIACFQRELHRLRGDKQLAERDETITEPASGEIRSVFCVHHISPVFQKMAADKRLADIARFILDDDVYVHQSRLNYKPGFRGKEFYWHSDFETWHVEDGMPRMRALSMSITLTENFVYNGPLMLIPRSHRDYAVCTGETPENHFKKSLKAQEYGVPDDAILSSWVEQHGIEVATGKPGSIIVFDCNTMHGSNGNITPAPRSNAFFVYNAMSNRVVEPFCNQQPRPEYIAAREHIEPVEPRNYRLADYRWS